MTANATALSQTSSLKSPNQILLLIKTYGAVDNISLKHNSGPTVRLFIYFLGEALCAKLYVQFSRNPILYILFEPVYHMDFFIFHRNRQRESAYDKSLLQLWKDIPYGGLTTDMQRLLTGILKVLTAILAQTICVKTVKYSTVTLVLPVSFFTFETQSVEILDCRSFCMYVCLQCVCVLLRSHGLAS